MADQTAQTPFLIRPFRIVEHSADGGALVIIAGAPNGSLRDLMASDAPARKVITAAKVEAMLRRRDLPSDAQTVADLVWALNLMRVTVPAAEAADFDPMSRLPTAVKAILEDGPDTLRFADAYPKPRQIGFSHALENLIRAAEAFAPYTWGGRPARHRHQAWHDDAMWLVFTIRQAEDRSAANRKAVFKSDTGNGVRFIQAALNETTGLSMSEERIRKAIIRYFKAPVPTIAINI